ncbi:hypothetical protein BURMUCF2_0961 [Burkholderia multivorans CF2]|nr:hypothetical protein BURMUCF2_0961 [Burkholderia multivorans CF2]
MLKKRATNASIEPSWGVHAWRWCEAPCGAAGACIARCRERVRGQRVLHAGGAIGS